MGLLDYGTLRLMIPGFKSLLVPELTGGTVIFTDDFSRADSSDLGANYLDSGRWGIGNGKAVSISPTIAPVVADGATNGGFYSGDYVISKPATASSGEWVIAFLNVYENTAITPNVPAGWNQIGAAIVYDGLSNNDICVFVYSRKLDGTEGTSWTTSFGGGNWYYNTTCIRLTGAHSVAPIDPWVGLQSSSGTAKSQPTPTIYSATPNSLAVLAKIGYHQSLSSGPLGWTQETNYDTVNYLYSKTLANAGTVASTNATATASDYFAMAALAIRGAESGSGGCVYKGAGLPNDHYIKATWEVPGFASTTQDAIILQIRQTDGDWTGYRMQLWMDDIGRNQLLIWRQDPYEVLYNVVTDTYTRNSPMVVEFGAQGNEVYVKIDGIEHVRVTDTSSPDLTGNSVGWDNVDWIGTFSGRVDNIEVGSL